MQNEIELTNNKAETKETVKKTAKRKTTKKAANTATSKKNTPKKEAAKPIKEEKAVTAKEKIDAEIKLTEETKPTEEKEIKTIIEEKNSEETKIIEEKTNKKKIAFVASECLPFAATGGLGDVIGSLPKALAENKALDIVVFLPLYGNIKEEYRQKMEYITNFNVHLAWRTQYCGIFRLIEDNVTYYFLDNEYYFKRDNLYGYYDDGERYAFFCHAVLDTWPVLNYVPDIVHAHDWQSALVPIYLASKYYYPQVKTVFTIHNVEYQGQYNLAILGDVFDLPPEAGKYVEYKGCINLVKGAIAASNKVTTVSNTYSKELSNPFFAHGLANIINSYNYKLSGILNGIDTEIYNPQTDKYIAKNYNSSDIEGKKLCKAELQNIAGLPQKQDAPIIVMISRLVAHKGIDLVSRIADNLLNNSDAQLIILGCGDTTYEDFFRGLAYRHPDKAAALICYNKELSHKVYAGADMLLMPSKSEPCGLSQMIASRYGTVPIVRKTGGLCDSIKDCRLGDGNGFIFEDYNADELQSCIYSAINLYYNKDNFTALVKYIMDLDFSWNKSADEYNSLYNSL